MCGHRVVSPSSSWLKSADNHTVTPTTKDQPSLHSVPGHPQIMCAKALVGVAHWPLQGFRSEQIERGILADSGPYAPRRPGNTGVGTAVGGGYSVVIRSIQLSYGRMVSSSMQGFLENPSRLRAFQVESAAVYGESLNVAIHQGF